MSSEPPAGVVPGGTLPPGTGVQVVVPCRDDGRFLDECLASVVAAAAAAGVGDVEVTIVDDGSTDPGTLAVLAARETAGWQVVWTPGLGLPAARNAGAAVSSSAAVLPLDVDNRLLPALLGGVALVTAGHADVVHGPWREFGARDAVVVPPPDPADALRPLNQIDNCALYSRTALAGVGGWDAGLPLWEDWDLLLRLHASGARFARLDDVTFEYRVRDHSLSGGFFGLMCAGPVLGEFVARHPLLHAFHRAHPTVYAEQFAGTAVDLTGLEPPRPRRRPPAWLVRPVRPLVRWWRSRTGGAGAAGGGAGVDAGTGWGSG